jgi:Fe-S cluster assembly iron-binding protein IscA
MLTVTDAALQHLQAALAQTEAIDAACFRITVSGEDSLGLTVQEPDVSDRTFECNGETVLATPEPLLELLSERVLDLDQDGQLVLVPQAA